MSKVVATTLGPDGRLFRPHPTYILIPFAVQVLFSAVGQLLDSIVLLVLLSAASFVISLMLQIGIFNAALMITRGERVEIARAFSSDNWGSWIAFAFVFGLCVGIGALFCGVGALFVLALWGLAPYYFLDQGMSLGEAFTASYEKTRATTGLPLAIALTTLVGWLGLIVCGVGALVTLPIGYVGVAWLYRHANNQPVAS